ncbi:MAG: hypothetical protein CMP11_04865 [Zetaproteobacteria bacterium]|nr:hypothetical protein [Pseudobdellovibrionaceae bacterium]|tara:strand:+ start:818 stop:2224 length:1407 start_codon:yes stop_codon:yes gene_type:complete
MAQLKIGIAGASGFVGRYLIEELLKKGYSVVALSRKKRSNHMNKNLTWHKCDLFSRKDTLLGLAGCDVAFYLTHSMMPSARLSQGNFVDYDVILADNFARSAKENKIKQIIYMGGIIPEDVSLSSHLLSRLEVERTLASSEVPLTSLRAGLIIGPEGSSFRIMYNLVKRLPIMICPSWTRTLSNPISIWDTIESLIYCINNKKVFAKKFDIGGTTTISYFDMMKVLGQKLNRKRLLLSVPLFSPELSKLWVNKVASAPKELVYPLIGSLKTHMIPNIHYKLGDDTLNQMSYHEAIDRILEEKKDLKRTPRAFKLSVTKGDKSVRSVQRLQTLYRFNAQEVSERYFNWLKSNFPFLFVEKENNWISIYFRGIKKPLISLFKDEKSSREDYALFYIKAGLLSQETNRGRLIFRTIIKSRYTMVEIHDFIPRMPWYIYKYTQAIIHLVTMKMFNLHLLKLKRNIVNHTKSE